MYGLFLMKFALSTAFMALATRSFLMMPFAERIITIAYMRCFSILPITPNKKFSGK